MSGQRRAEGADLVDMTDAENAAFEAAIRDPATIPTHEVALEIIDILDREIAGIEVALEGARMEAATGPLSDQRQDWVRRAAYACAMKRNERHRVMRRDREIRGMKGLAQQRKDPAEGLAKQARLHAEADAKKAAKQAAHARLQLEAQQLAERRSLVRLFVEAANRALPQEQYDAIMAEAKHLKSIAEKFAT